MTSSKMFILLLILLLILLFMYKQKLETFHNFKHLVANGTIVSRDGSYAESVEPHLLNILSKSTSKSGKLCIQTDTDKTCLDKTTAISAYIASEYTDRVDARLNRLKRDVNKISRWKKGTGKATERLHTHLSKFYYPTQVTYTKSNMDNNFVTNIPPQDYITFTQGARTLLPTDYDRDGYRYLLSIESRNRYHPHPGLTNEYATYDFAMNNLEPLAVPEGLADPRYSTDQFITMRYLDTYAPFRQYKSDFAFKLSETLTEQKRRYDEEVRILQQRRATEAKLLSDTKMEMIREIAQTKNKCDYTKASEYIREIRELETAADSGLGRMQADISRLDGRPSIIVTDADYAMTQIREQRGFATEALPIINRILSSIPEYIRRIYAATSIIELTQIKQEYVESIRDCEQYIANMDIGSDISKSAEELIRTSSSTLQDQLAQEAENAQRVATLESICSRINTMYAACSLLTFEIIIMGIEINIANMRDALYANGSTTAYISGITPTEGTTLLSFINDTNTILQLVTTKKRRAETLRKSINTAYIECNKSNLNTESANTQLQTATLAYTTFNTLSEECRASHREANTKKDSFFENLRVYLGS